MHEMSLAEGMLQLIEEQSQKQDFFQVSLVHLEIGQLSNVEVDAMRFCFDAVCKGTIAEGAELKITESAGMGWCLNCAKEITYRALYQPCPHCDGYKIQITGGNEMLLKELAVY
jgi:hydrogenase nickel incorporation protein HypA/HybF